MYRKDTFVDEEGNNNGNLDEDPLSPIFGNMFDAFRYNDEKVYVEISSSMIRAIQTISISRISGESTDGQMITAK